MWDFNWWVDTQYLSVAGPNLKFSVTLTVCELCALFFVSSWCVDLIGLFLYNGTLQWLGSLHASLALSFSSRGIWVEGLVPVGCVWGPQVAWAAISSGAVVLMLLIRC